MKKLLWRLLIFTIVGGTILMAVGKGAIGSFNVVSNNADITAAGLPPLRSEVTSVKIDERDKRGEINVSLIVDLDVGDPDNIASDMVAIFIWGRTELKPLVCGPDYPPNLCVQRWVKITWVTPKNADGDSYPIATIGLDQMAIDRLSEQDIHSYEELDKFFKHIAEESNGTALFYQEYPAVPEPFTGFK